MKIALVTLAILLLGVGSFRQPHREIELQRSEARRLGIELADARQRTIEATNQAARLEAERSKLLHQPTDQATRRSAADTSSSPAETFGPPGGIPTWPETGAFSWIEKKSIRALGLTAFRATDSPDREVSSDLMRLLNRVGREFAETHPEFTRLQDLSPDEALRAATAYKQALTDATSNLDESVRSSVASMLQSVDQIPMPGRMAQPVAEYQLNQDVATVLGLSSADRDAVNQLTREIVQRHQALERMHVAASDDHAQNFTGPNAVLASFKVAAFPDDGRRLREDWTSRLAAIVGPERAKYLQEMSERWIHSDLGDFGEAERTVTFTERPGSYGVSDRNDRGYNSSTGTGGPAPVPPGWRHLIARPAERGPPALRF